MKIKTLNKITEKVFSFYEIDKNSEISGKIVNIDKGAASIVKMNISLTKYNDEENNFTIKIKLDSDKNLEKSIKRMNEILKDLNLNIKLPNPRDEND